MKNFSRILIESEDTPDIKKSIKEVCTNINNIIDELNSYAPDIKKFIEDDNIKEANKLAKKAKQAFDKITSKVNIELADKSVINDITLTYRAVDRYNNAHIREVPSKIKEKRNPWGYGMIKFYEPFDRKTRIYIGLIIDRTNCVYADVLKKMNYNKNTVELTLELLCNQDTNKFFIHDITADNNILYKDLDGRDILREQISEIYEILWGEKITDEQLKYISFKQDIASYLLPKNAIEPLIAEFKFLREGTGYYDKGGSKDHNTIAQDLEKIFQSVDSNAKIKIGKTNKEHKESWAHPFVANDKNTVAELTFCKKKYSIYITSHHDVTVNMCDEWDSIDTFHIFVNDIEILSGQAGQNYGNWSKSDISIKEGNIRRLFNKK